MTNMSRLKNRVRARISVRIRFGLGSVLEQGLAKRLGLALDCEARVEARRRYALGQKDTYGGSGGGGKTGVSKGREGCLQSDDRGGAQLAQLLFVYLGGSEVRKACEEGATRHAADVEPTRWHRDTRGANAC